MVPNLMTPKEVAAKLKISQSQLASWRKRHEGPPFFSLSLIQNRRASIRYDADDLHRWLIVCLEECDCIR